MGVPLSAVKPPRITIRKNRLRRACRDCGMLISRGEGIERFAGWDMVNGSVWGEHWDTRCTYCDERHHDALPFTKFLAATLRPEGSGNRG